MCLQYEITLSGLCEYEWFVINYDIWVLKEIDKLPERRDYLVVTLTLET